MKRTAARELAFQLIYSLEVQKIDAEERKEGLTLFLENNEIEEKQVIQYITDAVEGITKNEDEIAELIASNLKEGWELSRVSKINIAILKLAVYEMVFQKLPYKVVINEGVELAKNYGDDDSKAFVNGILASIVKQLNLAQTTEE